ncbi:hypothetical protein A1395_22310 [Pseudomonas protegens]|uniref:hypothetical protein n=1 Tax=Pseudomonas protegens TaxID=380021 RepID=UPI000CC214D7|nr:hypothetical protein [Pseudomonas protegens]PNG32240.1 hypothetical protein A1395_22310 [Pseudomonas protegens]
MLHFGLSYIVEHPNCSILYDLEVIQRDPPDAIDRFREREIKLGRPFETELAPGRIDLVRETAAQGVKDQGRPDNVQRVSFIKLMAISEQPLANALRQSADAS